MSYFLVSPAWKRTFYDTERERNYDIQLSHLQHETLENGYIISRDEQGNVTHIIDAEYSWQVAVAMVKAEE